MRERRRVLGRALAHLRPRGCAASQAAPYPRLIDADPDPDPRVYGQLSDEPLVHTEWTHDAILSTMRTAGCALLPSAIRGDELERMLRRRVGEIGHALAAPVGRPTAAERMDALRARVASRALSSAA